MYGCVMPDGLVVAQEYDSAIPLEALVEHPLNAHLGCDDVVDESIGRTGFYGAVYVQRSTKFVLAGNTRLRAMRTKGAESIPGIWIDCDDETAERILLIDNRSVQLGSDDDALILALLERQDDLTGTGFVEQDQADLVALLADGAGVADPDAVPVEWPTPKTVAGDVWRLGPHRVLCGSSTDPGSFAALLAGDEVDMVWTDPPYGVEYESAGSRSRGILLHKEIANDNSSAVEDLLRASLGHALGVTRPGGPWYVTAPSGPVCVTFLNVVKDMGVLRQVLTWVKDSMVMGRSDFHYIHESVLYGWAPGAKHTWLGDRKQVSVLEVPRPKRSKLHPTMKPVDLITRCIELSCPHDGLVLDPFAGSGSTLIAAEVTGRRARLIELEAHYVDLICARFQMATGVLPVLDATEKPHDFEPVPVKDNL